MKPITADELKSLIKEAYWQGYKDAGELLLKLANGQALDQTMKPQPNAPRD